PDQFNKLIPQFLEYSKPSELEDFYELSVTINGNKIYYYWMNFFIRDDTYLWEVYVSSQNEICIIGCEQRIRFLCEYMLHPYKYDGLQKKYEIIAGMFNNEESKIKF